MTLNANQARAVAIRLRLLEERLALVRHLMDVNERGTLYRRDRAAFTPGQRARIEALMAEVQAEIASVTVSFGLPAEEQDAARRIVGLLAMTWQSLGDIRAGSLGAHGAVDPGLRQTLDPSVERLLELVLAMEKAASGSG